MFEKMVLHPFVLVEYFQKSNLSAFCSLSFQASLILLCFAFHLWKSVSLEKQHVITPSSSSSSATYWLAQSTSLTGTFLNPINLGPEFLLCRIVKGTVSNQKRVPGTYGGLRTSSHPQQFLFALAAMANSHPLNKCPVAFLQIPVQCTCPAQLYNRL